MSAAVSIVMPVHGRAALTARCLDALLAELPGDCELIVVDDASTDSTPALLASYEPAIRVLTLDANGGYAHACNAGAALAAGDALVFLNNDVEPHPGWLRRMRAHAAEHPAAAVVGAKLLYPNGTVQHAGVAIGQDGYPHNLYAGLPAGHPAVNRSRRLQAVTGACMLVARAAFERAGGFDPAYLNSLEDVDLCLRIGQRGGEVRYCHDAVLTHLESASRGREQRFERSVQRWRERWRERAQRDDLLIYAEDGLLQVEYPSCYPVRLSVSPLLAAVHAGRESQIDGLLERYAAQVADLLGEVLRLTALSAPAPPARMRVAATAPSMDADGFDHAGFLAHAGRVEQQVLELQQRLQGAAAELDDFSASRRLGYRHLVARVRSAVDATVPAGATVLVVSRGDRELVELGDRQAWHFPQAPDGGYLGHHPRDSEQAIAWLEELRGRGAEYLVLPATAHWWLEHYRGFAERLRERCALAEPGVCSIFALSADRAQRVSEVAA